MLIAMDNGGPPAKKHLSYERDRRNTYGENDKSSRKNIPVGKRLAVRASNAADRPIRQRRPSPMRVGGVSSTNSTIDPPGRYERRAVDPRPRDDRPTDANDSSVNLPGSFPAAT